MSDTTSKDDEHILVDLHDLGFHGKDLAHLEKLVSYIKQYGSQREIDGRDNVHRMYKREIDNLKKERDAFLKQIQTHICPMVIELPKGYKFTAIKDKEVQ